ncbi:MAG: ATP-binding protein [Gammaproteobacteria bacterium]|nr:ATP-binding protein [Gammaproteobacteria bacterium]
MLLIIFLPIVMLAYYQINHFTDRLDNLVTNVYVKTSLTEDMFSAARERSISLLRLSNLVDVFDIDDEQNVMSFQSNQFLTAREQLQKMEQSQQEKIALEELNQLVKIAAKYQMQLSELLIDQEKKKADELLLLYAIPSQGKALEQIKRLLEVQKEVSHAQLLIDKKTRDSTIFQILVLSCSGLICGALIFYYISYKINHYEAELKESNNETLKAWKAAEIANVTKAEFLANMSHEMRTPMHSIISFSEMGVKKGTDSTPEKQLRYFSNIKTSADRLMILINNLFDLTKLESGKFKMNFEKNSLLQVMQACLIKQKNKLDKLGIQVNIASDCSTSSSQFDSIHIAQVINNLLLNAIKYTPSGQTINVLISNTILDSSQSEKKTALLFSIMNSGKSIPEGEFETIFEKFTQSSDTVLGTSGGVGLGLPICKEIIEAHSGKIWADKHPEDHGTVFNFVIPIEQT